jgi:hypothetical protein
MARSWCRCDRGIASGIAVRIVAGVARAMTRAMGDAAGGRWDLATTHCYVEAVAPRVRCNVHEVVVAAVPWARHDAGFTRSFEDTVAWLTVNTSKTAICVLMRIAWRTVGRICERVSAEAKQGRDLFAGLKTLGFELVDVDLFTYDVQYPVYVAVEDDPREVEKHPEIR